MTDILYYWGKDPRDAAAYGMAEAAQYLKIPPITLGSWVADRTHPRQRDTGFFSPLILAPEHNPPKLSFHNLVEAYVLRALRTKHAVSLGAVRKAIDYAQRCFHIDKLLLSPELRAGAGELFLDRYSALTQLSRAGQLAMRKFFEAHLERIEWDQETRPARLYPFPTGTPQDTRKGVVIDACRAFGRPIIARRGISTAVIVDRIDAGEKEEAIAADYDLTHDEIEVALDYEQAA